MEAEFFKIIIIKIKLAHVPSATDSCSYLIGFMDSTQSERMLIVELAAAHDQRSSEYIAAPRFVGLHV